MSTNCDIIWLRGVLRHLVYSAPVISTVRGTCVYIQYSIRPIHVSSIRTSIYGNLRNSLTIFTLPQNVLDSDILAVFHLAIIALEGEEKLNRFLTFLIPVSYAYP